MRYRHALLTPSRLPGAEAWNDSWLGPTTLGVEVTEAELASRCGLGNIDPQHGFGGGRGRAAIEAALEWPLPPSGAALVTIRPDADALGAMAVLEVRAEGPLEPALLRRVDLVASCDAFNKGGWKDWVARQGPIPARVTAREVSVQPLAYRVVAALAADQGRTISERVALMGDWLRTGRRDPKSYAPVREAARSTVEALENGEFTIFPVCEGRVARLRGSAPYGLQMAYRIAPVVVAEANFGAVRKVTIAQFERGWIDLRAVASGLSDQEPGWGGSDTIIGSPQGVGTALPLQVIEAVVDAALVGSPGC